MSLYRCVCIHIFQLIESFQELLVADNIPHSTILLAVVAATRSVFVATLATRANLSNYQLTWVMWDTKEQGAHPTHSATFRLASYTRAGDQSTDRQRPDAERRFAFECNEKKRDGEIAEKACPVPFGNSNITNQRRSIWLPTVEQHLWS